MKSRIALLFLPLLILACDERDTDTAARDTAAAHDTDSTPIVPAPDPEPESDWTVVTTDGVAGIKLGMAPAQAEEITGIDLVSFLPDTTEDCYFLRPSNGPKGLSVMVANGTIVRIDVQEAPTATPEGARVGDTEKRIIEIYGEGVEITPHKYVDGGHYLTVPTGDPTKRIIFETDGRKVTYFRVGMIPHVEWIEGCS